MHKFMDITSERDNIPFHLSSHQKSHLIANVKALVPTNATVFRNSYTDSRIKSSEWLQLQGELGTHLVCQHISLEHCGIIQRLFAWMQTILRYSQTYEQLDELEREIRDILANFKLQFPVFICSINFHFLLHIVDHVRDFGPVYSHWNFSAERHFGRWKRLIIVIF